MTTTPSTACPRVPGLPPGCVLRSADALLAVDRPARLELEVLESPSTRGDAPGPLAARGGGPLRPGRPVELLAAGDVAIFRGRVERCGMRIDADGMRWRAVAWADWELRRREHLPRETWYETTDAEIATRIAHALGLEPRVEGTGEVHRRLERRGDPLRFLRERADACGVELAVDGARLWFARQPAACVAPRRIGPGTPLVALEIEDRGSAGRGGRLEAPGDPGWALLGRMQVRGQGPAWDGTYRVLRIRHRLDGGGHCVEVEFLERGCDLDAWRGLREDGP